MSRPDCPRLIFWEITEQCNFACTHCRRAQEQGRGLKTEDLRLILHHLSEWKGSLLLFTGGEPTLRQDLPDLANEASRLGLIPLLATNGATMTAALASRLKSSGIDKASVSLLGDTPRTHDAKTGLEGSFLDVQRGVRLMQDAGISVQINFVVTRSTAPLLKNLAEVAVNMRAVALHLFLFVPVGRGCALDEEELPRPDDLLRVFPETHRVAEKIPIPVRFTCCPQYLVYLKSKGLTPGIPVAGCGAGKSVLFISAQGRAYPCGYFPLEVGDLLKSTGPETWHGSELLRDLADPNMLIQACGSCPHRDLCGGCRARSFAATGNPYGQDPLCPFVPKKT